MNTDLSFSRWLRQRRRALDLTQADLAARVGCATDTLRKIESGTLRPSRQIAERLAELLAIPADERATFIRLARGAPVAHAERGPYVGLNTFQSGDAAFFFGREATVAALIEQMRDTRFLAVLGPSGSGKSSVVLAGLLPALWRGALRGASTGAISRSAQARGRSTCLRRRSPTIDHRPPTTDHRPMRRHGAHRPKLKTQNSKLKTQNSGHRPPTTDHRPMRRHGAHRPKLKTQNSKLKTQATDP
jgi:transcriptional regulator with XRE-family HTH domain